MSTPTPPDRCAECGALVPVGRTCRENLYALLVLEGGFPDAPGSILHFYAVATYNLQHPVDSGLTPDALRGLRRSLADALDGRLTLPELRARTRRAADGPQRVLRREGEAPAPWPVGAWPLNIAHVLDATDATYAELVTGWARSVREAIEAALGGVRPPARR